MRHHSGASRVALLAGTLLLLGGCSGRGGYAGLNDMPLPGGPDLGDGIEITVELEDALNLARQSSVKVDDVTIGQVESIERQGWHAEVTLSVREDVDLPANTIATVRQTGLLGEKFIELAPPYRQPAEGRLQDGAVIELDDTGRSFEVEEVLGSLSLLLNGGGIDRIRTITTELHAALDGREREFRDLLGRLNTFTGTFARNRRSVERALDGLDELSREAAKGSRVIARTLDDLGGALEVLADQQDDLTRLLQSTTRLGRLGSDVIDDVQEDLVANLTALTPTLDRLADVADLLPRAVPYLLSFPFPDAALQAVKGDFVNFDARVDVDLAQLLRMMTSQTPADPGPRSGVASRGSTR